MRADGIGVAISIYFTEISVKKIAELSQHYLTTILAQLTNCAISIFIKKAPACADTYSPIVALYVRAEESRRIRLPTQGRLAHRSQYHPPFLECWLQFSYKTRTPQGLFY